MKKNVLFNLIFVIKTIGYTGSIDLLCNLSDFLFNKNPNNITQAFTRYFLSNSVDKL